MNVLTITIATAAVLLIVLVIIWIVSSARSREKFTASIASKDKEIVRCESALQAAREQLTAERALHARALEELKASQKEAIDAARTALALENEKTLKAREESLKKEAAETMKNLTGGLDKDIQAMKQAFDAQKLAHAEGTSAIKTKFDEAVKNLREQTDSIGSKAENLANALKGKNKMQGIFGETVLENILKEEGLRPGHDYDSEFWLRDKDGALLTNEDTGRRLRPDFALHFPDDTDVLIDSKVSLSALADYFAAQTDEERADAARRNLESVISHVRELTGKEYQKYVHSRKTLDYVIMFIPNYGAYQLAKQSDRDIFAKAFAQNVLITTEETLIPFLRLIRTAWVQKEQMENISEIVDSAQKMVDRVALFCEDNAKLQKSLEGVLEEFKANTSRLVDGRQSIVRAALDVAGHGVKPSKRELPLPAPLGKE